MCGDLGRRTSRSPSLARSSSSLLSPDDLFVLTVHGAGGQFWSRRFPHYTLSVCPCERASPSSDEQPADLPTDRPTKPSTATELELFLTTAPALSPRPLTLSPRVGQTRAGNNVRGFLHVVP